MADPSDDSLYEEVEIVEAQLLEGEGEYGASGEEDEYEDEDDDEYEEYIPLVHSPRALQDGPSTSNPAVTLIPEEPENSVEEEGNKRRRTEGGEACSSLGIGSAESSQGNEWNRADIDGLFCPICMDAWTNNGEHHIWCKALNAFLELIFVQNYVILYLIYHAHLYVSSYNFLSSTMISLSRFYRVQFKRCPQLLIPVVSWLLCIKFFVA